MASLKEVFYDAGELLTSDGSVHPRYFRFISGELRLFQYQQRGFYVEEDQAFMKMDLEEDYQFIITV